MSLASSIVVAAARVEVPTRWKSSASPAIELSPAASSSSAAVIRSRPAPDRRALELRAAVLDGALRWFLAGGRPAERDDTLLGRGYTERGLRKGLEAALREVAQVTSDSLDRFALVDRANAVRPRSWL